MKIVKLKCPNCGANLNLESNKEIIKCKFCGINTIIDDEKIVVEHKIKDDKYETILENALVYLNKLNKYDKAKELFLILSEIKPGDPQIWQGLIESETKKFTELSIDSNSEPTADLSMIQTAFEGYCALVEEDNEFKKLYNEYHKELSSLIDEHTKTSTQKKHKVGKVVLLCCIVIFGIILALSQITNDEPKKEPKTTSELIEEYYEYTGTLKCPYFKEGIVDITYDYFITKNKVYEITRSGLFSNEQHCRVIGSVGNNITKLGELKQFKYGDRILTENGYNCDVKLSSCEEDYWSNLYFPSLNSMYGKLNYTWAFRQKKSAGIPWNPGGYLFVHDTASLYYYDDDGSGRPIETSDLQKIELNFEEDEKILHIGKNITTNKGFYYVKEDVLNSEECSKYVDIPCVWGLRTHKLNRLSRVYDDIYFAGRYIVAKDGSIYYGYSKK